MPRRNYCYWGNIPRCFSRGQTKKLKAVAQSIYSKSPNENELKAFGLTLDDFATDAVEIWPEHQQSVELFIAVSTQWRMSMSGVTGLDYTALQATLNIMNIEQTLWPDLFDDIRVMEAEALNEINKKE